MIFNPPDVQEPGTEMSRVLPGMNDDGMQLDQFQNILLEIRNQPQWRVTADREADYIDGNQIEAEVMKELEERGQAPLITNLIKPTINVVLGMEAKTRTDWKVRPEGDDEANTDLADALSLKLHKAEVESRADRACSDAYAGQIGVGIGWIEVGHESDPFKAPFRVRAVHRREMFWDWRAKNPDVSDARYLLRRQWMDKDVVAAAFPDHAELIRYMFGRSLPYMDIQALSNTSLLRAMEINRGTSIEEYEWINTARNRICMYELWYKQLTQGHVLRLPSGRVVQLNLNDPKHVTAILSGAVMPKPATFLKTRLSWWAGPHCLYDGPTPYSHNHYPYVPFFGYREDRTGVPYGLARSMISPQDEINARKRKMMWLLSSKRVVADGDAVADHNKTAEEVSRPDAYIILNENRKPTSKFEVEDGGSLANQQLDIMQEAKQEIQQAAGVYQAMLGNNSNSTSGIAINSLVEQGTTGLADINDNYRYSRRMVGELLFDLVKEDIGSRPMVVNIGEQGQEQPVILNEPSVDQFGMPCLKNDVQKVNATVVLDDIPSTPTYRMQQLNQLTELTKSLPPQAQALIIDFVIESTDLPKRQQMADRLRKGLNIPADGDQAPDPQVQALQQQLDQLHQVMQSGKQAYDQQIAQLQQNLQNAQQQLNDKSSEHGLRQNEIAAKAQEAQARTQEAMAKIELEREKMNSDNAKKEMEIRAKLVELQSAERVAKQAALAQAAQPDIELRKAELDYRKAIEVAEISAQTTLQTAQMSAANTAATQSTEQTEQPKEPATETQQPPAPVIHVHVGGKKSITVKRDKSGKLIGADVVEQPGEGE